MYKATITSKGQITLPAEVRKKLDLKSGEKVTFVPGSEGEFRMRRAASILDLAGCVPYSGPPVSLEDMKQAIAEHEGRLDLAASSRTGRRPKRPRKRAA